jgi:hypothetical protein
MDLDSFIITINNTHLVNNEIALSHSEFYGSNTNIVYAVDITATATKNGFSTSIDIEHVHTPFDRACNFIEYNDLQEPDVIEWAKEGLVLMNGPNGLTDVQNNLEKSLDKMIADSQPRLPWKRQLA